MGLRIEAVEREKKILEESRLKLQAPPVPLLSEHGTYKTGKARF
jgi:hypothetical protein